MANEIINVIGGGLAGRIQGAFHIVAVGADSEADREGIGLGQALERHGLGDLEHAARARLVSNFVGKVLSYFTAEHRWADCASCPAHLPYNRFS